MLLYCTMSFVLEYDDISNITWSTWQRAFNKCFKLMFVVCNLKCLLFNLIHVSSIGSYIWNFVTIFFFFFHTSNYFSLFLICLWSLFCISMFDPCRFQGFLRCVRIFFILHQGKIQIIFSIFISSLLLCLSLGSTDVFF